MFDWLKKWWVKSQINGAFARFKDMTPDQIADWLYTQGYQGRRSLAGDCPMARYIRSVTGLNNVLMGGSVVEAEGFVFLDISPENVRAFVRAFDAGTYPLVDSEIEVAAASAVVQ